MCSRPPRQTRRLRWSWWATGALLLPLIAIPVMAAAQGRQLQLVSTAWSPFTNAPGQARVALDLVDVALERVGITAETVIVDEARLTPLLLSGEVDGSAALWQDTERERALIYSQPYLENRLILVGRQGSDVSATSLADLAGKRVALVAGYAYGEVVETTDGPTYVGSDSEEDSLVKLLNGEADYTLMDDLVVQYLINNHGEEARTRLAFGSAPLLTRSLHFAVRRSLPDAESIISRFNAELRGMIADGSYHRLLQLDWIRADVDGDGRREYVPHADQTGPRPPERSYELFATGQSDRGARRDAALLLRRQHLRRLVHRARAVQGPGLQQTRAGSEHGQNLHLHVVASAGPVRPCHVIPSKISAHVAFVSVIRLSDVSKRFDGRAYRETRTEPLVAAIPPATTGTGGKQMTQLERPAIAIAVLGLLLLDLAALDGHHHRR